MADETQQGAQTVRMVKCVKLAANSPASTARRGRAKSASASTTTSRRKLGRMWINHSKMLLNEFRLNPLDPNSLKIMEEQMEQYFFGEGAKLPEGYVPPKH